MKTLMFQSLILTALLALGAPLANAAGKKSASPYRVCGKFILCGAFTGPAYERGTSNPSQKEHHLIILELQPGVVTLVSNLEGTAEDNIIFTLRFDDKGKFKFQYFKSIDLGEGSCSNFVCRFAITNKEWEQILDNPVTEANGTISFANGQIMRSELRTFGGAPYFVTGVLDNVHCNPQKLEELSKRYRQEVTEFSCLRWVENQTRINLPKIYRK